MSRSKRYPVYADDHVSLRGSPLSPWTNSSQPSLHELHMANAVRVGPGRYKLAAPKIFSPAALAVDRLLKSSTSEEQGQGTSTESDRTQSPIAADIAVVKLSAMAGKPPTRKRIYFRDSQSLEDSTRKKLAHNVKQLGMKYQDQEEPSLAELDGPPKEENANGNGTENHHNEERPEMLMEPTIDVDTYEEVEVTEEYDSGAGDQSSPFLTTEGREVVSGNNYRELKGENNYLKEQLQASVHRVKQLEALLLQRNAQVKKLVSENLQLSIKCRKLMGALAEDEIREALR